MERIIDLRSDTVTKPSQAMRTAMANAVVGDDVLGEDPTVNELESRAAALTGKEAALFVPSGTFANQLAIMTHISPGGEVYLSEDSHIIQHECGAASLLSSAFLRTITPRGKWLTWNEIEPRIRKSDDIHFPRPSLIEIENPLSNGTVLPLEEMARIREGAKKYGIPLHTDGARIFNASSRLGLPVRDIASNTDTLMFCLSKGLTAPVGSLLCGPREFISHARRNRKIMGGGMRQAGILAAAGLFALDHMVERLSDDHDNARVLAEIFDRSPLFLSDPTGVEINMVFVQVPSADTPEKESLLLDLFESRGILTYPAEGGWFRFVTNNEVNRDDMNRIESLLPSLEEEFQMRISKL